MVSGNRAPVGYADDGAIKIIASQGTHREIPSPSLTPEEVRFAYEVMDDLPSYSRSRSSAPEQSSPNTVPFTPSRSTPQSKPYLRHTSSSPSLSTPTLSHLNSSGAAHMISVTSKTSTHRTATATCTILFSTPSAYTALATAILKKGDALAIARIAGIMATKKTADLIPLAHPSIGITGVNVDVDLFRGAGSDIGWEQEKRDNERAKRIWKRQEEDQEDTTDSTSLLGEVTKAVSDSALGDKDPMSLESRFGGVHITATVECEGKTGVEMEALSAASVAGLTVYDMCKGVDKGMVMQEIRVVKKTGGKSGDWVWDAESGAVRRSNHGPPPAGASIALPAGTSTSSTPRTSSFHSSSTAPPPKEVAPASTTPIQASELSTSHFNALLTLPSHAFLNELHHSRRKLAMLEQVAFERSEVEIAATRKHVKTRQDEIEAGTRGRVEQEMMEREGKLRRRRWERRSEGTVLRTGWDPEMERGYDV